MRARRIVGARHARCYCHRVKPLNERTTHAMAKVRQTRTTPEETVALTLRRLKISYRRNVRSLPGKPDFVNQTRGWAIQVHGCFWHQHGCRRSTLPSHNRDAWIAKFERNKERDREVESALRSRGLRVLTLWECELKDSIQLENVLNTYLR